VKTSTSEVEVDLSVNKESENYDEETPLRLTKQILSSSKAEDVSDYAVGVLKGKLVSTMTASVILWLVDPSC